MKEVGEDPFLVSAFHGVYRVLLNHAEVGAVWALADLHNSDFAVHIAYRNDNDVFCLSGPHDSLVVLASAAMRVGQESQRLRYVSLARLILDSLEDALRGGLDTARWN